MKILITGSCGHIGSHLIRFILRKNKNAQLFLIDNMSTQRYASIFNLPKNRREDAVTSVVKEIKSSGFIDEWISKASKIIEKAIEDLESVQKKNIFIDSLIDLAKFSMNRDK